MGFVEEEKGRGQYKIVAGFASLLRLFWFDECLLPDANAGARPLQDPQIAVRLTRCDFQPLVARTFFVSRVGRDC